MRYSLSTLFVLTLAAVAHAQQAIPAPLPAGTPTPVFQPIPNAVRGPLVVQTTGDPSTAGQGPTYLQVPDTGVSSPIGPDLDDRLRNMTFFWFRSDIVLGWSNRAPLATPLVTTGPANDPRPGALGPANPNTVVLFGGNGLNFGTNLGYRLEAGMFLDDRERCSFDVSWLGMATETDNFRAASDAAGNPVVARPLVLANTGESSSFITTYPGATAGATQVNASSTFWNLDANLRNHQYWNSNVRTDVSIGLRFASLRERIQVRDSIVLINDGALAFNQIPLFAGDQIQVTDLFRTSNQFYGTQFGSSATYTSEFLAASAFAKLGIGFNDRDTNIEGSTYANSATLGTGLAPGGILAQVTNIGDRHSYAFAVVPEIGIDLCCKIHRNISVTTRYSALYWTNVLRPGDLINPNVNVILPPLGPGGSGGPSQPAYVSNNSNFVLQTLDFGIEFRY